jgi:hypothetical protein
VKSVRLGLADFLYYSAISVTLLASLVIIPTYFASIPAILAYCRLVMMMALLLENVLLREFESCHPCSAPFENAPFFATFQFSTTSFPTRCQTYWTMSLATIESVPVHLRWLQLWEIRVHDLDLSSSKTKTTHHITKSPNHFSLGTPISLSVVSSVS